MGRPQMRFGRTLAFLYYAKSPVAIFLVVNYNTNIPNFTLIVLPVFLYAGPSLQDPLCPPDYRQIGQSCAKEGQAACGEAAHKDVVGE